MNYSITPIRFRGTEYSSIKLAIESTGLSRYLIKKEAEYVNPADSEKFIGTGRKQVVPDTLPSKEEVEKVYEGNVRNAAKELGVTERVMNNLIDQYHIKKINSSEAKILKSDKNRPSKEELIRKYDESSITELLEHYSVGYSKLMRWFQYYGIEKRSRGETSSIKTAKRHEQIRPPYSVIKDQYDKFTIYDLALKYGVDKHVISNWLTDYDIDISRNASRVETELYRYCRSIDDSFIQNDRTLIAPLELDILSHKYKLAIEYCGVYWHSETAGKTRQYHRQKYLMCRELGYKLLTIFETDNIDKVKALIRTHVGSNNKIYARKTTVREINSRSANDFHNNHHLSGSVGGSIHIGLYYSDELVMVASFIKTRYNKNVKYECSRMTSHSNYTVTGGASRLFKYFFRQYHVESCVTYADLRFGEGAVYTHCGFTRQKDSNPNYFYFKGNDLFLESRVKYQKHKLPKLLDNYNPEKSEYENMIANGYHRIWDCGNAVYLYFREL